MPRPASKYTRAIEWIARQENESDRFVLMQMVADIFDVSFKVVSLVVLIAREKFLGSK